MFIENATQNLANDIKHLFHLWKNDIRIHNGASGTFDIDIPAKVPFILKYNSMGNPVIECSNGRVELDKDNFFMITIV